MWGPGHLVTTRCGGPATRRPGDVRIRRGEGADRFPLPADPLPTPYLPAGWLPAPGGLASGGIRYTYIPVTPRLTFR